LFSKSHELGLFRIQASDFRWEQAAKKKGQRHKFLAQFELDVRKNVFSRRIIQPWDGSPGGSRMPFLGDF